MEFDAYQEIRDQNSEKEIEFYVSVESNSVHKPVDGQKSGTEENSNQKRRKTGEDGAESAPDQESKHQQDLYI
ncbi:hypothetical protein TrispH2_006467 [Trichoplax sp. H2]|nr:hypothetical protein TrispH2_006467 [Trichoplax sp. H2]|eukprot:RDD42171.1 hypothetical protein TrispH2_006467 [Trichoplax sp. H2]